VIGAFVLLAAGLMAFGGGKLFQQKTHFVTLFEGSVKGLRVGSNVSFRGVPIGYVTDIQIALDADTFETGTLVTLEMLPKTMRIISDGKVMESTMGAIGMNADELIKRGLRAQLDVESFVTGQLIVELDLHPDQPAVMRVVNPRYPEIPSIPSNIQIFMERVRTLLGDVQNKVPVDDILKNLEAALAGLSELAKSTELREAVAGLNRFINARETQGLPARLDATIGDLGNASRALRVLAESGNERLVPALEKAGPVVAQLDTTLKEAEQTLKAARGQLESNPETALQLADALKEVEGAARALRVLVDYLERHPEALLRGKEEP
jgi:paraquat-inducible protein B